MKNKSKFIKFSNLIMCAICTTPFYSFVSSCAKEQTILSIFDSEIFSEDRECKILFHTTLPEKTKIHAEFYDYSDSISIENPDISASSDGVNELKFVIGENVFSDRTFSFKIKFSFPDSKIDPIISKTLTITYLYRVDGDDGIRADEYNVLATNSYEFDYHFKFQHKPLSDVKVDIIYDFYQVFSFSSWGNDQTQFVHSITLPLTFRDYWWYVDLTIFMKVCFFEQKDVPFTLKFSFINSKGKPQETILPNLSASLMYFVDTSVPYDFFNISVDDNGLKHLNGFKRYISEAQIKSFPILHIPDDIDVVDSLNLFDGSELPKLFFDRIIIGKNVKTIKSDSLKSVYGTSLVDASLCDPNSPFTFESNVFADDFFNYGGAAIIPNCEDTGNWNNVFISAGFTQEKNWDIVQEFEVIPDESYNVQFDETIQGYKLVGFNIPEDELCKYSVIKMPILIGDYPILAIDDNAFDALREHPYIPDPNKPKSFGNRHLSFTPWLTTFMDPEQAFDDVLFSSLGLSGLLNIPKRIKRIPDSCFDSATKILASLPRDSFTEKPLWFNYLDHDKIESFGDSAFKNVKMSYFSFPGKLKTVDNELVQRCSSITEIDFSEYTDIPSWEHTCDEEPIYFDKFVGEECGYQIKIYVSSELASIYDLDTKEDDFSLWLVKHGLINRENWQYIVK